jgi:UTP--glucose-1-phosphate uridylyltransferase
VSDIRSVPIRKAVIPAAGLGVRMLPVTKVLPKEMMPIGNKPLIQYAVEEAAASGIEEVVFVTAARRSLLECYFRQDAELERLLEERGRVRELQCLRALSSMVRILTVHQPAPRGLGDALLCARTAIGDEPFALILPDAIMDAPQPVIAQLAAAFRHRPGAYIATRSVAPRDVSRFGMLAVAPLDDSPRSDGALRVLSVVEKPKAEDAPSHYGVFGRYLLTPEIFDFLDSAAQDENGEVQLSGALARYCQKNPVYALCFEGRHYDAGSRFGYLQAALEFALKDPELGPAVRNWLTLRTEPRARAAHS